MVTEMRKKVSHYVILSKMSEYAIIFNKTKCMSFSIEDDKMLAKYNTIWDIVSD